MTGEHGPSGQDDDFTIADMIGENFPSPAQLAERFGEVGLRNRIADLHKQLIDVQVQIAELESKKKRLNSESLLAQEALRIASDKGLE